MIKWMENPVSSTPQRLCAALLPGGVYQPPWSLGGGKECGIQPSLYSSGTGKKLGCALYKKTLSRFAEIPIPRKKLAVPYIKKLLGLRVDVGVSAPYRRRSVWVRLLLEKIGGSLREERWGQKPPSPPLVLHREFSKCALQYPSHLGTSSAKVAEITEILKIYWNFQKFQEFCEFWGIL